MIEKHLILEDVDPAVFYGVQGSNWRMVKSLFPKLRLMARDNVVKAVGEADDLEVFDEKMQALVMHCAKYNSLTEEDILDILRGQKTKDESGEDVIVYSTQGRPVRARSENQLKLVQTFETHDLTFAVGPAGTGKTYMAIALAVRALKNREIKRIILTRPAVEAGERLGFLPGDLKDKLDPYLQPLYDALADMIPSRRLQEFMADGTIQIAPLAYMRGRTLDKACVILDEAQNTNLGQLKMFLTRMGVNAKFIVTGDATQIDLPRREDSGLLAGIQLLEGIKGIATVRFSTEDIVRHPLVTKIVRAFDKP